MNGGAILPKTSALCPPGLGNLLRLLWKEHQAHGQNRLFISDGTGITAETLGHSLLSQFGGIQFDQVTIPYVASDDLTREAVARIDRTALTDGAKPIVFSTLVNDDHRAILHTCKGKVLDLFTAFQQPLRTNWA